MELREGLTVEDSFLDEFAARRAPAPASDVDLLAEFRPGRAPGLLQLAQMELELETRFGRKVELHEDLSR